MKVFGRNDKIRLFAMLVGGFVLAGLAVLLEENAVDNSLREAASGTADHLADFLAASIPNIDTLLESGEVTEDAQQFVDHTSASTNLVPYRILGVDGDLLLESGNFPEDDELDGHDDIDTVTRTASTGVVSLNVGRGDGLELPLLYAEAYVPLIIDGQIKGVIEVYVDESDRIAPIRAFFLWTGLGIVGLTVLAFLMPLAAYLQKSREARETITFVSRHDDLTKLHNRSAFRDIVQAHISRGAGGLTGFDILFVDLDRFKNLNDTRGHAFGDAALRLIAKRLQETTGPQGEVSRFGGDEFAVFHPVGRETDDLGGRIVAALGAPFTIDGVGAGLGASVGVSSFPRDGNNAEALLKAADIALYEAKQGGRGRCVHFEVSMEEQIRRRLKLESRLRDAIAKDEFAIYYQPLVDADRLAGFEALLRLQDDEGAPIPPSTFIPVAEQIGLIHEIGMRTLAAACRTAKAWPQDLKVSVNLSPLQFESGDLLGIVAAALDSSGLEPIRLELEVTESVLISDTASVLRQLTEIKGLGVSIALDDFGTGYSSLSYLWMFPFDRVKVDRSFISRLSDQDAKSREMLSSILALGRSLEMSITAEGVETVEQSRILRHMKVDTIQGYLYGKPIPETELAAAILKLRGGFEHAGGDPGAVLPALRKLG